MNTANWPDPPRAMAPMEKEQSVAAKIVRDPENFCLMLAHETTGQVAERLNHARSLQRIKIPGIIFGASPRIALHPSNPAALLVCRR
jgi:hypothetical protein